MKNLRLHILTLTFILVSCGGGGGGSEAIPSPSIPLATINLSSDLSGEVEVGIEYTFTWTTSNASSCSSSGDWNETVGTSGSYALTLNEAKLYTFTLSCTNSDGRSSSSSKSITANYLLIGGKIIHPDNSGKTVYIDQNYNKVFDSFEYSGESDSNGSYQIRSMDNLECIKDFPVAVNNTYLYSINHQTNKQEVNISPLTSIFRSIAPSMIYELPGDFYNSETPCNLPDNYVNSYTIDYFEDEIELQENITLYSYADIQQDPATSSKVAIDSSRFEDLDSFYISLNQLEDQLVTNVKSLLDQGLSGTGFSSADYTITSASDINNRNIVIFLNEQNYPASLSDTYSPSSVEDITLKSDFSINIDPNDNVSTSNLNGWDESFNIYLLSTFITNDGKFMRDNENCYVNFSSYCILDIANDIFGDSSVAYRSSSNYRLIKETSRGIERLQTAELINEDLETCNVSKYSMLTDTVNSNLSDTSYVTDVYANRTNDIYLDWEGDCVSYNIDYKWIYSAKNFDDGSRIILSWDNDSIDALPDAYDVTEFDSDNLPPDQIENQIIEEFIRRPSLPIGFDAGYLTMTDEYLDSIASSLYEYTLLKNEEGQFSWAEYYVENNAGGNAYVTIQQNDFYDYYVGCYNNGVQVFYNQLDYTTAYTYLDTCLKFRDVSGDFIFSRSSTYKYGDNINFTVSPYSGLVPMSNFQTSPETESLMPEKVSSAKSETEQIKKNDEERIWLKKNKFQSASNLRKTKPQ
jgi:hypothetical protein